MLKRADITEDELKTAEEIVALIMKDYNYSSYTVACEVIRILTVKYGATLKIPAYEEKDKNGNGFFAVGLF